MGGETTLTAYDLKTAIISRYAAPEWHIEPEVTLGGRRLDVVALNMWAARQYRVVGFEIKVSRGDWLRELNAFQKSEEWCAVVDAFYVVTPPKLVKDGELPEGWGLLELCGSRMMTRAHAKAQTVGTTLPREIAARFISRLAAKDAAEAQSERWRAEAALRTEIKAQIEKTYAREHAHEKETFAKITREHSELLKALGISPQSWQAHENALRAAGVFAQVNDGHAGLQRRMSVLADEMAIHAQKLRESADALNAPAPLKLANAS